MNEMGFSALNIMPLAISLVTLIVGLVLWFFVNRSSSRANDQIALLEELVDLQKRQNALLRRLCEANEPESEQKPAVAAQEDNDDDFVRLVAER
ncbi:YebO family protein [Cedecea sp. P7760]|jgi:hypothetical protein|uniref:YebO family protein n=1 Tax=Cedecea TaxID=158483 RepID=UPI0015A27628|nr:YebO family protein [Cedecea sp. P7760]NWC62348.1 YebO family protein [Cedecea sp. P7760]